MHILICGYQLASGASAKLVVVVSGGYVAGVRDGRAASRYLIRQ